MLQITGRFLLNHFRNKLSLVPPLLGNMCLLPGMLVCSMAVYWSPPQCSMACHIVPHTSIQNTKTRVKYCNSKTNRVRTFLRYLLMLQMRQYTKSKNHFCHTRSNLGISALLEILQSCKLDHKVAWLCNRNHPRTLHPPPPALIGNHSFVEWMLIYWVL